MPAREAQSDGLIFRPKEKMGLIELGWDQLKREDSARAKEMATMWSDGLVIPRNPDGSLDDAWRVIDEDDDGSSPNMAASDFLDSLGTMTGAAAGAGGATTSAAGAGAGASATG